MNLFFVFIVSFFSNGALATPTIAIRESANCVACHDPGRSQLPVAWRRCTLDCAGCHMDPNGAGARNQWGSYYTQSQMAIKSFLKPTDPLKDASRFDMHFDARNISRSSSGQTRWFPMASSFTLRVRPLVRWVHLVYTATAFGRIGDKTILLNRSDSRRFRDSVYSMVDGLPMNLYLKAGRGQAVYGLRRSNHSLWIRERIGLDEFATTDSVNFGGTPNVPFFHVSKMSGDPYQPAEDRQKGTSYHFGLGGVSYGWNVNASGWNTRSEKTEVSMNAWGAGLHAFHILLYGERNIRKVDSLSPQTQSTYPGQMTQPASSISEYSLFFTGVKGVMIGGYRETLKSESADSKRFSATLDLHPIPWLQVEAWRRWEVGSREIWDTLFVTHLLFDF